MATIVSVALAPSTPVKKGRRGDVTARRHRDPRLDSEINK
jgi:hypothetical protein